MPEEEVDPRKTFRAGEATQRFSALQPQLLCAAIHFFHRHIRNDPDVLQRMEGNQMFRLFFEVPYHNKPDLNRIFPESVHDCSPLHVCSFILSILHQGIFSVSAFIVSVIYLSRFKESSHITLHACTWRPLFLTSLLLADKMWEDKPVRNSSLAKLFPVLSNVELNKMEGEFLGEIRFNVLVKPDLFCSFCEKLLAEQVHADIRRCFENSEYAGTLQQDLNESPPPVEFEGMASHESTKSIGKAKLVEPPPSQLHPAQSLAPPQLLSAAPKVQVPPQLQAQCSSSRADLKAPVSSRATVGGVLQRPSHAWVEATPDRVPSGAPPPGAGVKDSALAPRSQSAGPTASSSGAALQRSEALGSRGAVGPRPQVTSAREPSVRPAPAAVPLSGTAKPLGSLGSRSISVHPLNRTESLKKHPKDDKGEQSGHLTALGSQALRRSLPAKSTNSAYIPLARAPSAAGPALAQCAAATPSSACSASPMAGSHEAGTAPHLSGSVAMPSRATASPRSPVASASMHLPHDQAAGLPQPVRSTSQGRVTPPMQAVVVPKVKQSRSTSPGGGTLAASQQNQSRSTSPGMQPQPQPLGTGTSSSGQPSRSSSAPRTTVPGQPIPTAQPLSGNARTAALQGGACGARQPGRQAPSYTGHTPSPSTSPVLAGQSAHFGQATTVVAGGQAVRGSSPVATQVGGLAALAVRSTLGGTTRNASPVGLNSPAASIPITTAARGRSPPPLATTAAPGTARQPRAITPSTLVKGLTAGINTAGMCQRGGLGPLHRGF